MGGKAFKIPAVLDKEERQALLSVPNTRYFTGLRNKALMTVLLNIGLRIGEALALSPDDINWQSGRVHVRQRKKKKDRILWLNASTLLLLIAWRERMPPDAQYLFVSHSGKPISDRHVRTVLVRYKEKAGLKKHVYPHLLRHTFATDLYRDTKDIRLVQRALGHKRLTTTEIYTHIVDEELEEAMRRFREEED